MKYSDETLMAYADGELEADQRAEIAAAIASDPELARAVERHRALAARVRADYGDIASEPVPDRLSALLGQVRPATVTHLAARREASAAPTRRWRTVQWALAASVVVALFVGVLMLHEPTAPYASVDGRLVARGKLDRALTTELAALPGGSDVNIGISFRDREGRFCRTFHLQQDAPVAGLACFGDAQWELAVLADAPAQEAGMRTAAAMPLEVLQAVDAAIDGEPLDAQAELAARAAGWRGARNVAE